MSLCPVYLPDGSGHNWRIKATTYLGMRTRVKDVHGRRCALEDGESRNLQISETVNGDVRADREGVMQGLPLSNTDSSLQSKEMK